MYSLNCPYFTESFDSISELIIYVTTNCSDPNYEITKNNISTGEMLCDLLQF
jgi:hypothetical protein